MIDLLKINSKSPLRLDINKKSACACFDFTNPKNNLKRQIIIHDNASLNIFGVIDSKSNYDLEIILGGKGSNLKASYVFIGSKNEIIKFKISAEIKKSFSGANIHLLALVCDDGNIFVDGNVHINKGLREVSGYISEENIFLGEKGRITSIPAIKVESDDIKAGHSLKIEKIGDEKIFYLQSRGLGKDDATRVIIESLLAKSLGGLDNMDKKLYKKTVSKILSKINI